MQKGSHWFQGPLFLWHSEKDWPVKDSVDVEVRVDNPELKKEAKSYAAVIHEDIIGYIVGRIFSWHRLKRIIAVVLCFKKRLLNCIVKDRYSKQKYHTNNHCSTPLDIEAIRLAEMEIIKSVQRRHFGEEIISLEMQRPLKSSSSILKLDPFMDSEGVLRVGGQIQRSTVAIEIQHLVLLPKCCRIAELIVRWCHENVAHGHRGMTINQIRSSGFWVTRCNSFVRSIISKCVQCKQLRGKLQQQKTADLPKDRMSEETPFSYCGITLFGPFVVKYGREEVKRYGALYTCLSRAIHIEVVHSMSTDSFIMSLRRFTGCRGNVMMIRSDNGSNLVGASAEPLCAFQEMDHIKITNFLEENGGEWIHWKRNPPLSSNMGGVWEQQIRTARAVLNSLLKTYGTSLSDKSLKTLLVEVEAVVNSCPLTTDVMNDITSLAPPSLINLLTLKSKVVMPPPGNFVSPDQYNRKHWRRVQHIQ